MSHKLEFIEKASARGANISALCREYGISRQTGHKWLRRFRGQGYTGLVEQSRRPLSSPLTTGEEIVVRILGYVQELLLRSSAATRHSAREARHRPRAGRWGDVEPARPSCPGRAGGPVELPMPEELVDAPEPEVMARDREGTRPAEVPVRDVLTVYEVAHRLGVHPNTVRTWVRLGYIASRQPAGARGRILVAASVLRSLTGESVVVPEVVERSLPSGAFPCRLAIHKTTGKPSRWLALGR